ncbi:S-adenosylmethionine decarboxylase/ornithine decarboxylase, putative [Plasmodium malariae]|uniref:S-adenosylmethionine decarboxylase-ornithine decarboxylase, putative n=1 Tax=Plasmodium malariae TaxID=5858 RepID=A0A1A8VUP1_PLAMA|nr:S-adenosylmethionine decarboxylase/ornithine decarboxylase, putative [Plasmodium malariae]SBS83397.1 S-adenosylmethionine decarboxylase-ornithine decarboxylase, putative [Plasmodium malariae]SCN45181.1 S-adenosylmethionine decarboxylase/ornithine decarboxylase, putative [Plasmodium malariae]
MSSAFEGIEKRVVVKLRKEFFSDNKITSLLDVPRKLWEDKLKLIGCSIISEIEEDINLPRDERCRVYLLSESSLFIYNDTVFIKTCGKTKVLFFIPFLVDLLIYKIKNKYVLDKDCLYDESFIKNKDLTEITDFIKNSFEYSFFTHMNYQNVTNDGYYEQEYPHKSIEDEKNFFQFFFKKIEFSNTPLSMNRAHYIFFAQVSSNKSDGRGGSSSSNGSASYYSSNGVNAHPAATNYKFCSEIHLFGIAKYREMKHFHELYLNEDSLNIFSKNIDSAIKTYDENEKVEICSSDYSLEWTENSSKSTTNTNNVYKDGTQLLTITDEVISPYTEKKSVFSSDISFSSRLLESSEKILDEAMTSCEDMVSLRYDEDYLNTNCNRRNNNSTTCSSVYDEGKSSTILSSETKDQFRQNALDSISQHNIDAGNKMTKKEIVSGTEVKRENAYLNELYFAQYSSCRDAGTTLIHSNQSYNNYNIDLRNTYTSLNNKYSVDSCLKNGGVCMELSSPSFISNANNTNSNNYRSSEYHGSNFCVKKIDTNIYECKNVQNKERCLYNEFYFTPCGYSCNVVHKNNYFCVHYSPEDLVSYVSIEVSCNIKFDTFMNFMNNQLNFYNGKFMCIINYSYYPDDCRAYCNPLTIGSVHNSINVSSVSNGISRLGKGDQLTYGYTAYNNAEIYQINKKLTKNLIINNNQYYSLIALKQKSVGFLKIQYFVYELKNMNEEKTTNILFPCGIISSSGSKKHVGNNFSITPLSSNVVNDMYKYSYIFCKQNKVMIVDIPSDSNTSNSNSANGLRNVSNDLLILENAENIEKEHKDSSSYDEQKKKGAEIRRGRSSVGARNYSKGTNNTVVEGNEEEGEREREGERRKLNDDKEEGENGSDVKAQKDEAGTCIETKHKEEMRNYYKKNKIEMFTLSKILSENIDTSVVCINVQKILAQYIRFKKNLPSVTPFYSVKSNNDEIVLKFLYGLNCNFDCASVGEIKKLIAIFPNIERNRIIYANTIKSVNSLIYAKNENVNLCTFDNIEELKKILKHHPKCSLLLRINVDFKNYKSYMSSKYGANEYEWGNILQFGKENNLNIIGVSFHVGSNTKNLFDYCQAIKLSRDVWNISKTIGYEFEILNLGGGYPEELEYDSAKTHEKRNYCTLNEEELKKDIMNFLNEKSVVKTKYNFYNFEKIALAINMSIEHYYKDIKNKLRIICEPGRYMVASSSTLAVKVIGKRHPTFKGIMLKDLRDEDILNFSKGPNNGDIEVTNNAGEEEQAKQDDRVKSEKGDASEDTSVGTSIDTSASARSNDEKTEDELLMLSHANIGNNFSSSNSKLGNITNIKKEVVNINNNRYNYYSYYVSDSIYGCFSGIIFDEYNRTPVYVIKNKNYSNNSILSSPLYLANIFGQSCDGLDMINSITYLPECDINDWIIYEYAGAYTFVSSSDFNGFAKCQKIYIFPKNEFPFLK